MSESAGQVSGASDEVFVPRFDRSGGCCHLWGTRGSIPTSGPQFIRHGGNTSCMEFQYEGERIIFDAGSGIRDLGQCLMKGSHRKIHLFITHTHWDHIQGFPFFAPAYHPDFDITIYGAKGFGKDLESLFKGQLDQDYFPVQMDDMHANLTFKHLEGDPIRLGDITIKWAFTQHPGATVGYRIEVNGRSIVYIPDNEFLEGYLGSPHEIDIDSEVIKPYRDIVDFASGADLLLHEAQYTQEEYVSKIRWGHSSVANACKLVKLANPKRWIVIHHDPMHNDDFLLEKLNSTRQLLQELGCHSAVAHGFDGFVDYLR